MTTTDSAVGRAPEDLSLTERFELAGKWIALERYTPPVVAEMDGKPEVAVRLRLIAAIANSTEECIRQLKAAGHDPSTFEFTRLKPPFGGLV
jgi:hypothetical protein